MLWLTICAIRHLGRFVYQEQIRSRLMREAQATPAAGLHFRWPTGPMANGIVRVVWQVAWFLLARWMPLPLHDWRATVLKLFGAKLGEGCR